MLYMVCIVASRMSPIPDLSAFPTTSYRWSVFLRGGFTAGVVEEMAFRGDVQAGIERDDRANVVWITSLVFVALHITQGIGAVLLLGPGLFVAAMLFGTLAPSLCELLRRGILRMARNNLELLPSATFRCAASPCVRKPHPI